MKLTNKQQEWLIQNNKEYPIICKLCKNKVNWNASKGKFNVYCSYNCANLDKPLQQKLRKQSCLEKYGVEHPQQNKEVQHKTKQTNLEKYGHENIAQGILKEKVTQSMIKQYGVKYPNQHHMVEILSLINNELWLFNEYIVEYKTATQIGYELGITTKTVCDYLRKHNITIRYKNKFSNKSNNWIISISKKERIYIQHALNEGEYPIPGTRYKADGYCVGTNTIYEFYGDRFHGNIKVFKPEDNCHPFDNKITAGELYQKTIEREHLIKSLGYNLVVMWESDFT